MEMQKNKKFKYRKWPLFLPVYAIFTLLYYFVFSENNWADSLIWAIFFITYPLLSYFYLRLVKVKLYYKLGLHLVFAWFLGSIFMFLLALTYMEGLEWFGFLALLFYYFVFGLVVNLLSFILFKINLKKHKHEGKSS